MAQTSKPMGVLIPAKISWNPMISGKTLKAHIAHAHLKRISYPMTDLDYLIEDDNLYQVIEDNDFPQNRDKPIEAIGSFQVHYNKGFFVIVRVFNPKKIGSSK